jgi:hypothetical protein
VAGKLPPMTCKNLLNEILVNVLGSISSVFSGAKVVGRFTLNFLAYNTGQDSVEVERIF